MLEPTSVTGYTPVVQKSRIKLLTGLIIVLVVIAASSYFWWPSLTKWWSDQAGLSVTKEQIQKTQSLINGPLKSRAQADPNIKLIDISEAEKIALRQAKIEQEAKKRGLSVSEDELTKYKDEVLARAGGTGNLQSVLAVYGWTEQDWEDNLRGQLLQQKVKGSVVSFREIQMVSVRWDGRESSLKQTNEVSKQEVKAFLEGKAAELKNEQDFASVLKTIIEDATIAAKYTVQPTPATSDQKAEQLFKTSEKNDYVDYIFSVTPVPSLGVLFCDDRSCKLINILSKNDGAASFEEWLGGPLPW